MLKHIASSFCPFLFYKVVDFVLLPQDTY